MVHQLAQSSLIVIVGETASGKSALALQIAQQLNGEILCADSRTVYKEMNIGTAKPSSSDRRSILHYGLDLVNPNELYNVADFQKYSFRIIDDIIARGKLPIMVGGSGLYIDAVIYNYKFRTAPQLTYRNQLASLEVDDLRRLLQEELIMFPENERNPRHLIRALETRGQLSVKSELRPGTLVIGLQPERHELHRRITQRVDTMLEAGLLEEIELVSKKYGWDCAALQIPAYKAFRGYSDGLKTIDQAKADFIQNDLYLAKRQRTWFRRNKSIHWLANDDNLAEAVDYATTLLHK